MASDEKKTEKEPAAPSKAKLLLPASESSNPDVHVALGNLQAARSGGDPKAIAAAEAALAELGYA